MPVVRGAAHGVPAGWSAGLPGVVLASLLASLLTSLLASLLWVAPGTARAHGGVVLEDDLCLIKIGYLEAHFKIYLPRSRAHREYCEDLPRAEETVFVMEYSHPDLARVPIEFRIVRNTTGLGRFAGPRDLETMDLDAQTVFHQPATVTPDVFTVIHDFQQSGEYIGVVTAAHPESDKMYRAVFPFRVGFTGLGFWPWLGAFALFLFGNLWLLRRRMTR